MAKPVGTTVRNKDNSKKHPHVREEWTKGKKIGRPKQRWVGATLKGEPFTPQSNAEIEASLTEETISSYVPAHWEKVK